MTTKKKKKVNPFVKNKQEIKYNLINSAIAGGLVFVGSIAGGGITASGILASVGAAFLACLVKFKDYWDGEKGEYTTNLLNFV